MRLYQMRDKIIYGTVRQYHIWFIPTSKKFKNPLAKYLCIVYNNLRRTARVLTAKWTSWLNENLLLTQAERYDTISTVAETSRLTSIEFEKMRLDKRQNCDIIISLLIKCGSSSVVEHNLAKVGVAGSSPVFRSIVSYIVRCFYRFLNSSAGRARDC